MEDHTNTSELDRHKKIGKNGREYWMGRDIQKLLGYADFTNFDKVVEKAKASCESAGLRTKNHISEITEKVALGSGATGKRKNYWLSRHGCYLIAMNGDTSKPQIAFAQTYFAVQTRRQEIADTLTANEQRIALRDRLTKATKDLNSVAKQAGVQKYGLFHDAGYRGLYGMGLNDVKSRKGISEDEQLFDRAGRSELAANYFRATQAAEKIERLNIRGEQNANSTHEQVGREVRKVIVELGNKVPEDLPAEPHIKTLKRKGEPPPLINVTQDLLLPSGEGSPPSD